MTRSLFKLLVVAWFIAATLTGCIIFRIPLVITPNVVALIINSTVTFTAEGGTPPYTFAVIIGLGTIDSSTGEYAAPALPSNDIVQVVDSRGFTATAGINVTHDMTSARFIAVAAQSQRFLDHKVFYSTDGGENWSPTSALFEQLLYAIAYDGAGRLVAVGYEEWYGASAAFYSTDLGFTWAAQFPDNWPYVEGVTADGTSFVATGQNGLIVYSTDGGESWTDGVSGTTNYMRAIATDGQGRWIAVGASGTIIYSTDSGATWTAGTSGTTAQFRGIAINSAGRWVAVASGGETHYSTDGGATWSAGTSATANTLYGIACDGTRFVAIGNDIQYSDDGGATWTLTTATFAPWLNAVTVDSGGRWVAVGTNGLIMYSDNGAAWTEDELGFDQDLYGIVFVP